ncbi:uncharacterized protein NPIL_153971 [Nephila pilipes]|uniref:Spider venom protein n=1 Tax=Nephila pilipes TaxID=299642 RepID=A0A8X6JZG1_NEPPI|nr:uncharacterized protein NPIL_294841 [Nephila pilipes]GFU26902.1 uncharacterized protein NPIL_153971 [Nephila pilipes]
MRIKREVKVVLMFCVCLLLAYVAEAHSDGTRSKRKVHVLASLNQPIAHTLQTQPLTSKYKKQHTKKLPIASPKNCPKGYKYDPYFKKCRKLVCAVPGYNMIKGKCVKSG